MPFKKGQAKIGGKKAGTPNATTQKAKELILKAIDNQSVEFDEVMNKIKKEAPIEWAKILVKMMDYVLPKKIDLTTNDKPLNTPVATWAEKKDG